MSGRFAERLAARLATVPRTVRWAFWVTIIWAALSGLAAIIVAFYRSYVIETLIKNNSTAKSPKADYVGAQVESDATSHIISGLVLNFIAVAGLVLLASMLLRARAAARWILLVVAVLPLFGIGILGQLIGGFANLPNAPILYRGVTILAGVASLVLVVLLVLPETSRYFIANRPARPDGAVRPSLFGRRPAAASAGPAATPAPARSVPADATRAQTEPAPRAVKRRGTATRPGSVKPKAGDRGGRSKSRNQ